MAVNPWVTAPKCRGLLDHEPTGCRSRLGHGDRAGSATRVRRLCDAADAMREWRKHNGVSHYSETHLSLMYGIELVFRILWGRHRHLE